MRVISNKLTLTQNLYEIEYRYGGLQTHSKM